MCDKVNKLWQCDVHQTSMANSIYLNELYFIFLEIVLFRLNARRRSPRRSCCRSTLPKEKPRRAAWVSWWWWAQAPGSYQPLDILPTVSPLLTLPPWWPCHSPCPLPARPRPLCPFPFPGRGRPWRRPAACPTSSSCLASLMRRRRPSRPTRPARWPASTSSWPVSWVLLPAKPVPCPILVTCRRPRLAPGKPRVSVSLVWATTWAISWTFRACRAFMGPFRCLLVSKRSFTCCIIKYYWYILQSILLYLNIFTQSFILPIESVPFFIFLKLIYCMSKMSWPVSYCNLQYKRGQDVLDILYIPQNCCDRGHQNTVDFRTPGRCFMVRTVHMVAVQYSVLNYTVFVSKYCFFSSSTICHNIATVFRSCWNLHYYYYYLRMKIRKAFGIV